MTGKIDAKIALEIIKTYQDDEKYVVPDKNGYDRLVLALKYLFENNYSYYTDRIIYND